MKKKLLFLIPVAGVMGMTLMSNTNEKLEKYHTTSAEILNHNGAVLPAKTGAPGENNCTQCHNAFNVLAATNSNGAGTTATSYQVGQSITFLMGSTNNTNNGFQMTILDNNGNKAGSFVAGAAGTAIQSSGGREYINHTTKAQNWTYDWVAPATDMGPLTAYFTMNATNNDGATTGDEIFRGTISLPSDISNGLTNHQKQDNKINMFFNNNANELNVKYALNSKTNVSVQVVDLAGKVVEVVDLGQKSFGPHSAKINLQNIQTEGIYMVTLFLNNQVYTRKVYLK